MPNNFIHIQEDENKQLDLSREYINKLNPQVNSNTQILQNLNNTKLVNCSNNSELIQISPLKLA